MADQTLFTDDFKTTPYWWEAAPRPEIEAARRRNAPTRW